jgi:hypothetical protein
MARSNNNIITHGMSGMIGDMLVFRHRAGKTIVSAKPKHSNAPATVQQQAVRDQFQQAVIYGKSVTADPTAKAAYAAQAAEGQSAYNIAVADFFNAPDISEVDVSAYTGSIGSTIRIKATDDFAVAGVHVKIENPDNSLVEEGDAAADTDGLHWVYTATTANTSLAGDKITITAKDTPKHETTETRTL